MVIVRKKKEEDPTEEEIKVYIDSLPQQSKIHMHRHLAQWRNLTGRPLVTIFTALEHSSLEIY
jgi:hypothetical protein